MRVLLVKPEFRNVFTKLSLITTEPLELEYMSAICQANGVEVQICDLTISGPSLKSVLKKFNPDIVAMTANFVHIYSIKKYVEIIKKYNPSILTIVGGPHAEVMPEDFYFDGVDIISHSGGYKPFEKIITSENNIEYENLKGICYCKDNKWLKNEREVFEVNSLPFPDRTHFYKNIKKYKYVTMNSCAILKTSYSCPHNCNYCFSTLLNGGKYICRDPKNVVEEIKNINCDNIWIVDDTFYVDTKKLDEFIELIKEEKINKKYSLYFRADFIASHPEYMKKLADIGVSMCAVGLEVIDDEVLEKYNKKSSVNIILKAVEVLKSCNITCIGLFMVDIDAEVSYFKKLYNFIKQHELYLSTISILTPMPGTGQFEKYKERIVTNDYRKWDFVHLTITPTKMSRFTFYREFYKLYVKLAMLNLKAKVLSPKYIRPAIAASIDYWKEVFKSLWGRKKMRYEVWENLAHKYNNLWVQKYSLGPTRREVLKIVNPLLEKNKDLKIIDIGCGTGQLIKEISNNCEDVNYLGIDVAENMIKVAKENNNGKNLKFQVCPIENFDTEEKFDIAICTHAFPYFPDKEEMLKKISRLCNENAEVIIVNSSTNSLKDLIINFGLKATTSKAKYLSIEEMKKLFEKAELKVKNISVIREKFYMPTIALFHLER